MFEFGIIDNPPVNSFVSPMPATAPISAASLATGRQVAETTGEQGTVLLKNQNAALPLSASSLNSVAVIGSDADSYIDGGGSAAVTTPSQLTTMVDGITARAGAGVSVEYAAGTDPVGLGDTLPGPAPIPSGVLTPLQATYRLGVAAPNGPVVLRRTEAQVNFRTGLSADTDNNTSQIPGVGFPAAVSPITVDWTGQLTAPRDGTYGLALTNLGTARLYLDDKLVLTNNAPKVGTTSVDVPLTAGKAVSVRVEYTTDAPNQFNGSLNDQPGAMVRLAWTPPADTVSPAIAEAVEVAKRSDVAVVVARDYTGEAGDRANLTLPQDQDRLISAVVAANPRTVVVLATGGAVTMPWLDKVPAVVQAWYGGQTQGESVASVIFGDVNPSGKLPITFPTSDAQAVASGVENPFDYVADLNPVVEYSEGINIGYRSYVQKNLTPLFPFGHGLSYTSFSYGENLTASPAEGTSPATATVRVTNTGSVAGTETVQLYTGQLPTNVQTPERALAGFARVTLAPGESKDVVVPIDQRSLQYWDETTDAWVTPTGVVNLSAGSSATDLRSAGTMTVGESATTAPVVTINADPATPNGSNGWYTTSVKLSLSATDAQDSKPVIEASVNGAPFTVVSGPITFTKDGTYTVQARAKNSAGTVSETVQTTVKIDQTKPKTAAPGQVKKTFVLSGTDETSGVEKVEYRYVTKNKGQRTTGEWMIYTQPLTSIPNNVDEVEYRAVDFAGNIGNEMKFKNK
jgi:beta-glucosidase